MDLIHTEAGPAAGCRGGGGDVVGSRNMKSMRPSLATIFFMTYFYRARVAMVPLPPGLVTVMNLLHTVADPGFRIKRVGSPPRKHLFREICRKKCASLRQ